MKAEEYVRKRLFELKNDEYKEFHSKLMPNIDKETIIGVKVPDVRNVAKEMIDMRLSEDYLSVLPHIYYEENNLHGLLINKIKDFGETVSRLDCFLPFVDNWATCDIIKPQSFKKRPDGLEEKAYEWIDSGKTYTVRFGIGVLMNYFLDDGFKEEHIKKALDGDREEYYVSMMVAWYLSFAFVKQYDAAKKYISREYLDELTFKRTVRKILDSFRVPEETKKEIKKLL